MNPRWDQSSGRWEASIGSGRARIWIRSKVKGDEGRRIVELKMQSAKGEDPGVVIGTLAEFIELWYWPRTKANVSRRTKEKYSATIKNHYGDLEPMMLTDIRLPVLQSFVDSYSKNHEPKGVRDVYGILKSILILAHKTGHYPFQDHLLVSLPRMAKKKTVALTIEQCLRLVEEAAGTPFEGPIFAAAFLGLRNGELCGLVKSDLKDDVLTVSRQRSSKGSEPLKSRSEGETRTIYLTPGLSKQLSDYLGEFFADANGDPISPMALTKAVPKLSAKAGLPRTTLHGLRHAFRTNLSGLGVSAEVHMEILGHGDIRTSMGYQGTRGDEIRSAMSRLESAMCPPSPTGGDTL